MRAHPDLVYRTGEGERRLAWWSELVSPPERLGVADDRTTAEVALRRARSGEAFLFQGDWHNARQLLAAMGRRLRPVPPRGPGLAAVFLADRASKRVEHELLGRLAVPLGPGWTSPLRRAPDLDAPLQAAFGAAPDGAAAMPLREVLGAVGAHQWRVRGVPVPALGATIHPAYGVFAPVRGEYVGLVAQAIAARASFDSGAAPAALRSGRTELPLCGLTAFDVGTGTGVLALLLARAGARVVATDVEPRAVACAREHAARFGLAAAVEVVEADLFPPGQADLVVANPPWIPAAAYGPLDRAVYDPGGEVLARLVAGLPAHLSPGGEAWLVLSDLAERVGVRAPDALRDLLSAAGLRVAFTLEARPTHPRARDAADPLAQARAAEVTRLHALRVS